MFCVRLVSEIERFSDAVIVKFASGEEAAEAVKCENEIRSVGSNIKVHLADSTAMQRLVHGYSRSRISCWGKDGSRSCSSPMPPPRKNYARLSGRGGERGSTFFSEMESSCRSLGKRPANYKNQNIDTDASIEKLASPRPTNSPKTSDFFKSRRALRKNDIVILAVKQDLIPYAREVLDCLGRHAAERGGALLEEHLKQQRGMTRNLQAFAFRSPRVVQLLLISEAHVEPCMREFTEDGFLYALVLTETNRKDRTCNLRILHTGEHQEHRNMPLFDALTLLLNDYTEFILAEAADTKENGGNNLAPTVSPSIPPTIPTTEADQSPSFPILAQNHHKPSRHISSGRRRYSDYRYSSSSSISSTSSYVSSDREDCRTSSVQHSSRRHREKSTKRLKRPAVVKPRYMDTAETDIPLPDDPSFLVPSKRMSTLLRMLADSRALSVGELDEILAFVTERKTRLINEPSKSENQNASLKARIMQTLYPGGVPVSISSLFMVPQSPLIPPIQSNLIGQNPVIRSAGTSTVSTSSPVASTNQTSSSAIPTRVTSRDSAIAPYLRLNALFSSS
ncbi:hypothetical protein Aperf_G00000124488 [Anoplocephala perfoliata]